MAGPPNPKESKVVVVLTAIDSGRWLPPHSVPGSGSLFVMGNAIFLRNQKRRPPHTLYRKWRWYDRKSGWFWIRPGQIHGGTTWRPTIVSGKKTSDCLNLPLGFFLVAFCFSLSRQLYHKVLFLLPERTANCCLIFKMRMSLSISLFSLSLS